MRIHRKLFVLSLLSQVIGAMCVVPTYAYTTKNGAIYDSAGNQVLINGVAWIGFQDSNFLGGLWNVPFNTIGNQNSVMQLLTTPWSVPGSGVTTANGVAFKSIRLAIQPGIWHNVNSAQASPFDFSATSSTTPNAGNGPFCDWSAGADASGHCIKSLSAANMLKATIDQFNNQHMYVMLDFHHRPGLGDNFRDGTVVATDYTLKTYYDDVANFSKTAPAYVLGIDVYNEPHQLYWFQANTQTNPAQPSWISVIAAAAAGAYDNNKNLLIFVEGPGGTIGNDPYDPVYNQNAPICLPSTTKVDNNSVIGLVNDPAHCPNPVSPMRVTNIGVNWGENFRELLDTTQSVNGVAKFNVTLFRTQLIQAITANNFSASSPSAIADWLLGVNNDGNGGHLVFAPHLYGAQVGGWQSDANDSQIRFKWNFGFLLNSGFPFVVGEIGYDLQMPASGGQDFFVNSVAPYLISNKIPNNLFFWTWNNADYPVGVRASDSNLTVFAWKEQDLKNLFSAMLPVQTVGSLCVTVPAPVGYTGTTLPTITATGSTTYALNVVKFDTPVCLNNVLTDVYTLTGNTLANSNGINYMPQQSTTATVTQNATTNATVTYAQQPTGTLQVNVSGDTNCAISATQTFNVTYAAGSVSKTLLVTGTSTASATLPVGSYNISVTPNPLPNTTCNASYNQSVNVTANTVTQLPVKYNFTQPQQCTVNATCSTWGTPQDAWAGSTCNLYINTKTGMTSPAIFTMPAIGIKSLTGVWNATASMTGGNIVMQLANPVYVNNIGFNAAGVISLPVQGTLVTNGQQYNCTIVKTFASERQSKKY